MSQDDMHEPEDGKPEDAAMIFGRPIRFTEGNAETEDSDEMVLVDPFAFGGLTCEIMRPDGTATEHPATFKMK